MPMAMYSSRVTNLLRLLVILSGTLTGKLNLDFSFGRFWTGFHPKLGPGPLPPAPARNLVHQSPKIIPGGRFYSRFVSIVRSIPQNQKLKSPHETHSSNSTKRPDRAGNRQYVGSQRVRSASKPKQKERWRTKPSTLFEGLGSRLVPFRSQI